MPPHCDSMDGPVVTAARQALEARDVNVILPYVPQDGEGEVIAAYDKVMKIRDGNDLVREVADLYFFETVVRIHRAGEGAPYTGLKPAGLDVGPVIPVAEKAIESGSAEQLSSVLCAAVDEQVKQRFAHMLHLKEHAGHGVDAAREYVEAMLGLQVWSHSMYLASKAVAHAGHHEHD